MLCWLVGPTKAFGCNGYDGHDYDNDPSTLNCNKDTSSITIDVVEGYVYSFRVLYVNSDGEASFTGTFSQDREDLTN